MRLFRIHRIGLCCAISGVVLATACSTSSHTRSSNSESAGRVGIRHGQDTSVAKSYESIREIRGASTAVVRGTVGTVRRTEKADEAQESGVLASATEFHVSRVLSGLATSKTILLHQVLEPDSNTPVDGRLSPGAQYVLFVTPFTFGPGTKPTGEWVIVGGQGAYKVEGSQLRRTSTIPAKLPETISLTALANEAR